VDDINVEEEIWDFFGKYITSTNTSVNTETLIPKKKLVRTVNLFGQEVGQIKNIFFLNIYDDGSVEKIILLD
jgi:hypothetical protein